jgi:hypothetical protein
MLLLPQAGTLIWLAWAALPETVTMKPELARMFWSVQYSGPAKNMVSPIKPCFGFTCSIELPKDKAMFLTKCGN